MPKFLDLPAELRNRVYRCILLKDEPIAVQVQADRHEEHQALAITRTNKQVRREASDIYYACNHFRFYYDCCYQTGLHHERHFTRELYDSTMAIDTHFFKGETMSEYLPQWCRTVSAEDFAQVKKLSLEGFCGSKGACRDCFIRVDVDIKERTVQQRRTNQMMLNCKQGPREADAIVRMVERLLAQPAKWLTSGFGRASMGRSFVTCFAWAQTGDT